MRQKLVTISELKRKPQDEFLICDLFFNTNRFGVNRYKEPPPKNFFRLLWEALTELVLLILLGAAIISIVLGVLPFNTQDSSAPPWLEGVAILVVIIVQIFVSVSPFLLHQRANSNFSNFAVGYK